MKRTVLMVMLWAASMAPITAAQPILIDTLTNGVGIRALSMGGAFTAVAEGTEALFYNPAGLAVPGGMYKYEDLDFQEGRYNQFLMHSVYLSPFGASFVRKQALNGEKVSVWSYGFGHRGLRGVDWGVVYKTVQKQVVGDSSTGWSADWGALIHLFPNVDIGFAAKDIIKNNVESPASFVWGISAFTVPKNLIVAADFELDRTQANKTHLLTRFGAEYNLTDGFLVRAGIDGTDLTGGLGLVLPFFELDYGVRTTTRGPKSTQYMLGIRVGGGIVTEKSRRRYSVFKPKAYAYFRLSGQLIGGQSEISLFGGQKIGSNDLLALMRAANEDPTCEGFVIRLGHLSNSITTIGLIQEIRNELELARKDGKKVVIYLENWAMLPEYYLASAADKIVMPELGTISHLGVELEVTKFKKLLNNFGIDIEVIKSGKYKTSLQPTTGPMTDADRVLLEDLIGGLYHQVLFDIKQSRNLEWDKVSEVFDGRVVTAKRAKELGLIDALGYWDVAKETVKQKPEDATGNAAITGGNPRLVDLVEFMEEFRPVSIFSAFNRIAVIEIDGAILQGANRRNFLFGGKATGAEDIDSLAEKIAKDFTIRGVIIRVNSPGGSIVASDRIYEAVEKLKKAKKPVYTSMGNIATSGGYYVAMNSDKILANRGTLTGSIGVFSMFPNFEKLNEILGIESEVVKTGKYMDMFSSNRKFTDEEREMIQNLQEEHYRHFVDRVAKHRGLTPQEVEEVAQGQVFTGEKALELKLIDKIGDFYDTVDLMTKDIKLKGKPELVYYRAQAPGWINVLFGGAFGQFFDSGSETQRPW